MRTEQLTGILENLFGELMHGVSGRGGFMLNHRDRGLLRSLERVSASSASAVTRTGSSTAAHVAHVVYGLSLLNRWAQGENPFDDADWAASWKKTSVTEPERLADAVSGMPAGAPASAVWASASASATSPSRG